MCQVITKLSLTILLLVPFSYAISTSDPPSFHQKIEKNAKNPIKYEYGYKIADDTGGSQIREEQRDGIYALGRYYVEGVGSSQKVEYLADNWGFHPFIQYSNVGPHSKSMTQIAFGEEAVRALHNGNKNSGDTKQHALEHIQKIYPKHYEANKTPYKKEPVHYYHSNPQPIAQAYTQPQPLQQQQQQHIIHQQQTIHQQPTIHQQQTIHHQQNPLPINNSPTQQYNLQPQPSQIPVYFIQGSPYNNYLYNNHQHNPVQTTILVPVKTNQLDYYYNQPQPTQMYLQPAAAPSALPLIYEQPSSPPSEISPQQHTVLLENVQENISNQLIEEHRVNATINAVKFMPQQHHTVRYGSKINAKLTVQPTSVKLIQSTRDLVTAQDVLNINESLQKRKIKNTGGRNGSHYVNAAKLSEHPIIVEELEENNLGASEVYSTTQNTVKTVLINQGIRSTEPTILVTPRPLSSNLLAPINAAIQLQTIDQNLDADFPPKAPTPKPNVVVEVQKSVPYYLGKFEFVRNGLPKTTAATRALQNAPSQETYNKYDVSAETAENIELGKSILNSFENVIGPQHLIQPKPDSDGFNDGNSVLANDQHQESGQIQYQFVPAQSLVPEQEKQSSYGGKTSYPTVDYAVQQPEQHNPIPYVVQVPQPYPVPVTKLVPQLFPVHVKLPVQVQVPVEVPRYVERPYPVYMDKYSSQQGYAPQHPHHVHDSNCNHNTPAIAPAIPTITHLTKVPPGKPVTNDVFPTKTTHLDHQKYHLPHSTSGNKPTPLHQINHSSFNNYKTIRLNGNTNSNQYGLGSNVNSNQYGLNSNTNSNQYGYGGLVPPMVQQYKAPYFRHINNGGGGGGVHSPKKFRHTRQSFGKNLRIEYGFMPPLIPSVEIDENGKPIEKHDD